MEDLEEKIALVTGASRGIGRAAALALAKAGADVAVNFIGREKEAHEVCRQIIPNWVRIPGILHAENLVVRFSSATCPHIPLFLIKSSFN